MSKSILQKLSDKLGASSSEADPKLDSELDARLPLNKLLDEHLDIVGAAHASNHNSYHGSRPEEELPMEPL